MLVLLAEDEEELSNALIVILKHSGYEVDAVSDGEAALSMGLERYYDAMVFDIMMPKLDGISALKTLREEGITTPVLLLTAKAEIDDRVVGLDAGADDYLTKPFAMTELLARLRAMTRHKEKTMPETAVYGNITLKRSTMELLSSDAAIRLNNQEFEVLSILMQNKNRLISAAMLLERVWPGDEEADMETVWMYISYIQKKLEAVNADFSVSFGEEGYRLENA